MISTQALVPTIYKDFKCKADKCLNNCCHDWDVALDEVTFKKYTKLKDHRFVNLRSHISRNRGATASSTIYGRMKLKEDGNCPLLNEEGICTMQQALGEDYLSDLCKQYPRIVTHYNGTIEQGLQHTCEAVIELLYDHTDTLTFEYIDVRQGNNIVTSIKGSEDLWLARNHFIDTLQDRSLTIEQRLFKLFLLARNMEENKGLATVGAINSLRESDIQSLFTKVRMSPQAQLELFKDRINHYYCTYKTKNKNYKQLLTQILFNLGYIEGQDINITENYLEHLQDYKLIAPSQAYFLENYLVLRAFDLCIPTEFGLAKQQAITLIGEYFMLKNHIICTNASEFKDTKDWFVSVASSYSRCFCNNIKFRTNFIEHIQNMGISELEYVLLMLK